jgi:DNA-binding NtrC family response regulator
MDFFLNNLRTLYHRPKLEVSKDTMEWLTGIQLPGNIRELKNLVERTVLVSEKDHLRIDDFLKQIQDIPNKQALETLPPIGSITLEQIESKMIKKALKLYQNNISHAAKSLGLSRGALYRRLDKYNIPHEAPG